MRTMVRVFSGEYEEKYRARLRAEFDAISSEPHLILDMRGVTYVGTAFANELLRLHKRRVENGIGGVSIVRNSLIVKRLFAILYPKALFHLIDSLEEALPSNGSPVVIQFACRGDESLREA
jgi:anti-anti-sigma regulatory factor